MLQLEILCGRKAGLLWDARRFPVRIGRSAENELQIEDEGVWGEHLQLTSDADKGFSLLSVGDATVMVNQASVREARLRNGDIITLGAVKLAFRLSPTKQHSLRFREGVIWGLIGLVSLAQLLLVLWLLSAASR